jgi:hypothetical protein
MRTLIIVGVAAATALGTPSAATFSEEDPPRVLRVVCDDKGPLPTSWPPVVEIQRRGVHLQVDLAGQEFIYFRRPDNFRSNWGFGWSETEEIHKAVFPGRHMDDLRIRPRDLIGRWRFGCFSGRFDTRDYRNRELARVTLVNEIR